MKRDRERVSLGKIISNVSMNYALTETARVARKFGFENEYIGLVEHERAHLSQLVVEYNIGNVALSHVPTYSVEGRRRINSDGMLIFDFCANLNYPGDNILVARPRPCLEAYLRIAEAPGDVMSEEDKVVSERIRFLLFD